jgi:hypothetical protein
MGNRARTGGNHKSNNKFTCLMEQVKGALTSPEGLCVAKESGPVQQLGN